MLRGIIGFCVVVVLWLCCVVLCFVVMVSWLRCVVL